MNTGFYPVSIGAIARRHAIQPLPQFLSFYSAVVSSDPMPHPVSDRHPIITRSKPYRFGFLLSTAMGNRTRYVNFRKYAERDPEVDFVWAPISHYMMPEESVPFRRLPKPLYDRAVVLHQAQPVLQQWQQLDAVMIHLFEACVLASLRQQFCQGPLVVNNHDDPPIVDPSTYPLYARHLTKAKWRQHLRLQIDRWCVQNTSLFIPWSNWSADIYTQGCGVPASQVHPIHVGVDLELWPEVNKSIVPEAKPKLLFVGGEFERKGGDLLLDVFRQRFRDRVELHLVTKSAPTDLPANVVVHSDFYPNDPRLAALYAAADIFVLPTRADLSSFASLEAMAASCPVIATPVGGIPDIVRHGETGLLVPKDDATALTQALETLLDNPAHRQGLGLRGRAVVEQDFNAAVNTPRILNLMKQAVDARRSQTEQRTPSKFSPWLSSPKNMGHPTKTCIHDK
jgi:glycosyltransferase involved in cell wall biosynthesis